MSSIYLFVVYFLVIERIMVLVFILNDTPNKKLHLLNFLWLWFSESDEWTFLEHFLLSYQQKLKLTG